MDVVECSRRLLQVRPEEVVNRGGPPRLRHVQCAAEEPEACRREFHLLTFQAAGVVHPSPEGLYRIAQLLLIHVSEQAGGLDSARKFVWGRKVPLRVVRWHTRIVDHTSENV